MHLDQPRNQLLLGTFVHSKSRREIDIFHNAAVAVDSNGKIAAVERQCSNLEVAKAHALAKLGWSVDDVDIYTTKESQFFFPGFIDTHIHAPQYPNAGIFGKTTLLDWLEKHTFPMEVSLKDLAKARKVYTAVVRRTLCHGTTTAAYYATIDVAATNLLTDLCHAIGQRAFVGRVCMDRAEINPDYYRDESTEAALRATRQTIEHIRAVDPAFDLVAPILTPRFAPSCTSEGMRALAKLQREGGFLAQTHISENTNEIALVRELFPASRSYADVYDQHGLLTPGMVLAHAVHLTEEEADLIALRRSKVSHCPCSNSSLTSGAARVRWMWQKGIEVGLGTDVSGGYSPSILEAARQAALVSRHVAATRHNGDGDQEDHERCKLTVEEVLYLATRGGALCLGLEDRVGGFEVGKDWDAQLVGLGRVADSGLREGEEYTANGHGSGPAVNSAVAGAGFVVPAFNGSDEGNVDVFGWESWGEILAKWLYNGDDRNTKKVWVKGRLVHARR
ncbi:guanine deaminase [Cordyceps fumosorosea ARSEF 2679]|uniref:Probable guanine deaminase n=1 Tax=Cordyceps fumosorosea (strain ARSEF 2679) TaxID=1081104 RepID=A0A168ANY6_CORFA|nr:guanine deaminase [Cordyceps fumosorosea ARSEF 2679]OAA68996.1 guanine deaminase [Cordyceps fumosorosea ARSEF 2679]